MSPQQSLFIRPLLNEYFNTTITFLFFQRILDENQMIWKDKCYLGD